MFLKKSSADCPVKVKVTGVPPIVTSIAIKIREVIIARLKTGSFAAVTAAAPVGKARGVLFASTVPAATTISLACESLFIKVILVLESCDRHVPSRCVRHKYRVSTHSNVNRSIACYVIAVRYRH